MRSHCLIDKRIITMHRIIGRLIETDPERRLLSSAKHTLKRWQKNSPDFTPYLEWEKILGYKWPKLRKKLAEKSDKMQRLRQSSPFAGCLPGSVRMQIIQKYHKISLDEKSK